MNDKIISVVAALIRDDAGRVLLVRKRGTAAFMQPGGKRDAGESDIAALSREIVEELGCCVDQKSARPLGEFRCASANEPGFALQATVYAVSIEGAIRPQAEIEQVGQPVDEGGERGLRRFLHRGRFRPERAGRFLRARRGREGGEKRGRKNEAAQQVAEHGKRSHVS